MSSGCEFKDVFILNLKWFREYFILIKNVVYFIDEF